MKSLILALSLVAALAPPAFAATPTPAKAAEYKRADANFYWKVDVLKVAPNAVIVPEGGFIRRNDSWNDCYFITGRKKAPKVIYAQVLKDWTEPITPPNATSLGVPGNVMQIRESQGDVQIAFPSAPATFLPVQDGMTVGNGSVVKTGANGTTAVVFGGVASARFIPNSVAAVQQTLTPGFRSTEIDLTRGAVFSKVGKPIGEKEDYSIHTPHGVAAAHGTDFVSFALPARTDVWIAEGTVQLNQPGGAMVGQISANGAGPLKIIRFPLMPDARDAMMADAETMTAAMNFIPMANQKIKALRDRLARGEKLNDAEMKYLGLIKKVPCLIKLALVSPPAPPPLPPATPPSVVPATSPSTAVTTTTNPGTSPSAKPRLMSMSDLMQPMPPNFRQMPSGSVTTTTNPGASSSMEPRLKAISDSTQPQLRQMPAGSVTTTTNPATLPTPVTTFTRSTTLAPRNIRLHSNGTVSFQGATISLDGLKAKLAAIGKATPDQTIAIKAGNKVPYDNIQRILGICHDAGIKNVTFPLPPKTLAPAPSPTVPVPAAGVPGTTNAPPAFPGQEPPNVTIP